MKVEKVHFEEIEVKVFGATFKNKILHHVRLSVNKYSSKLVFDADQHPQACLAKNDHSFDLIYKESTTFHGHLQLYLTVTQSKIDELVQNMDKNVIWNNLYRFPFKTQN